MGIDNGFSINKRIIRVQSAREESSVQFRNENQKSSTITHNTSPYTTHTPRERHIHHNEKQLLPKIRDFVIA